MRTYTMTTTEKVWRVLHPDGSRTVVGVHALAMAYAHGDASRVEEITLNLRPSPAVRELKVLRGMASSRGDDDKIQEAEIDLARLQHIESAALLALGVLWLDERHSDKVHVAYKCLRDALGGKQALKRAIQMAIDNGHEADHPQGADWWAGKKDDGQ
jgi:hypothetical protein